MRKFATNSEELSRKIQQNESSLLEGEANNASHNEEDQSYAKSSLGVKTEEDKLRISKVLGVPWNVDEDEFQLDFQDAICTMEHLEPMH